MTQIWCKTGPNIFHSFWNPLILIQSLMNRRHPLTRSSPTMHGCQHTCAACTPSAKPKQPCLLPTPYHEGAPQYWKPYFTHVLYHNLYRRSYLCEKWWGLPPGSQFLEPVDVLKLPWLSPKYCFNFKPMHNQTSMHKRAGCLTPAASSYFGPATSSSFLCSFHECQFLTSTIHCRLVCLCYSHRGKMILR